MITSIAMLPPSKPVGESPAGSATAAAKTQKSSTITTASTTTAAPTAFKHALQSARGKHKAAQPAPAASKTEKKAAAPGGAKAKTTPAPPTDDEQTDTAEQSASTEDESSDTPAQSETAAAATAATSTNAATATTAATPPAGKTVAKKTSTTTPGEEPETTPGETAKKPQQTNTVQAIAPDARQSGGKQQKSKEKTAPQTDATIEPPAPATSVPTNIAAAPTANVTDSSTSSAPAEQVQGNAAVSNQPAMQSHSSHTANPSLNQNTETDTAADNAVSSSDPAPTDSATDTDADSAANAISADTPPAPASTPAQHPIAAIADSLSGLAAIVPAHSTEPTSSTAAVSPARTFAEANQDQIVTTIKGQLLPDGGSMQITLHPDNLGHVRISVQVSAGSVSATFETSNDQATRLLSHNLGQLKQTLESAGVSVEKLQVTQSRDPQPQSQSDSKQSSQQQQTATDQRGSQQEQQRREILQQMWDKITGEQDWVDVKA